MMHKIFLTKFMGTFLYLLFFQQSFSQVGERVSDGNIYRNTKVYISIDVPEKGVANEDKEIFIDPDKGSYAYIIIDNYPNNFTVNGIVLKSYKKIAGQYEKMKQESFTIATDLYYTYLKYSFNSTGEFAFDVYDKNNKFIKSAFVTVSPQTKSSNSNTDSSPYAKAKVYCSIEVPVDGIAKEVKSIVINRDKGSYAYIVVDNYPTNFKVKKIQLKAYKKFEGKWESLKNESFDISTDYSYTYIKYTFYTSGEYAFDVYDANDKFINTCYITVKYKD